MARSRINCPTIVPNESLGAFIERYHIFSANRSWSSTSNQIFGRNIRHIHHYLPTHVGDMAQHFSRPAYELLMQHTAYPLFAYFVDQQARQKLAYMLMYHQDANVASVAGLCHIHSNRHGWVYCRYCQAEDICNYGAPAYQVLYQIPGISLCPTHLSPLEPSIAGSRRPLKVKEGDVRLATFAAKVLECAKSERWIDNVIERYWCQLSRRGFTASDNVIRYGMIKDAFMESWNLDLSDTLQSLKEETIRLIPALLHNSASIPRHPIKHLLLTAWLFDDEVEGLYETSHHAVPPNIQSPNIIYERVIDETQSIIELLQQGYSRRHIRRKTGATDSRVVLIAKQHGFPVDRRPKRLDHRTRQKIISLANTGATIADIAQRAGFNGNTVCKIIQEEPGLVERRKSFKEMQKRLKYQAALSRYMSRHPDTGRKRIRQACSKAWTWLYRHNPEWLTQNLPPPKRSGRKPKN